MKEYLTGIWTGLTPTGRTIVLVVSIVAVTLIIVLGMAWRYDWSLFSVLWGA